MQERMAAEAALLEVIPPDTRARVSVADTTGLPHRWICRLRVPDADPRSRSYGMGTGVLVGPRHVLTSAHVLVSETDPGRTVGGRLFVQPARNGDFKPFKEVGIRGWRVDPRWIVKNQRGRWQVQTRFDYGLVTLAEDVGSFKHPGLGRCTLAYWAAPDICFPQTEIGIEPHKIAGQQAWSAGYPGDREPGTLHGGTGHVTVDPRLGILRHTIDTHHGQSGSPIWIKRHGMWCLVGIHSRVGGFTVPARGPMVPNSNAAALVSLDVARQIEEWKRAGR
jgi:V8-like Glu-specific endopeptidase